MPCSRNNMITTQPIQPELRDRITKIRAACGHESASHSFPSVFLWQRDLGLSVCLREEMFAIHSAFWGENTWFFPCGAEKEVLAFVGELAEREQPVNFLYLREEDKALLERHFPGRFRILAAEDKSEYLYDREAYVRMPGQKYEDIRWSINHLKKSHELRTERLTAANLDTASRMLARWAPRSESEDFSADHETSVLMLENYEALGMSGVIVYMDGEAAALASGFPLSESSYDIAFSKTPERERGLQFYVRRELISTLPGQYTTINGEEDLGIPGLRDSKLLENPIGRIEMFSAFEK